MNATTLRVLEYADVRRRVVDAATCSLGAELVEAMAPATTPERVRRLLDETREATALLEEPGGRTPFGGIHDVRPALRLAAAAGVLDPSDLSRVADTAAAGRHLKAYLLARETAAPVLAELARRISEHRRLEQQIEESIQPDGTVADDASELLARLRREIRRVRDRMSDRIHSIVRSGSYKEMLQDAIVTTRDGRMCVPIKSECRGQFPGLVHDQSASGATLFIEPAALVELGNELRQAELREAQEVERILRTLSALVGEAAPALTAGLEALGRLDFIFARARCGLAMDALEPRPSDDGCVFLRGARHPLLPGTVVPLDVEVRTDRRIVVITGPNTGGKTVALKTVGLLALMAQSGLFIPAREGSRLPVFRGIYADIGDEQSLQQSLSTFSGHITNIVSILRESDAAPAPVLVLLDELGAGTDPQEGAALARAILLHLLERGAYTLATSHYGELKTLAYQSPGLVNASVEFDEASLRPTYRLLMGVPGTSHALAIAARLGLPASILEAARQAASTDELRLDEAIRSISEDRRLSERDAARAAGAAREAEALRDRLARQLARAEEEERRRARTFKAEKDEALRGFLRELDGLLEQLRRDESAGRRSEIEPVSMPPAPVSERRERLRRAEQHALEAAAQFDRSGPAEPEPEIESVPPEPGDAVWVQDIETPGVLEQFLDGERAVVRMGAMHVTVPRARLRRATMPARPARKPAPPPELRTRAIQETPPELDLRGMKAEEAVRTLDGYLDRACLAGLSPLRLIHGKGTGALKRAVWEHLQAHPVVAAYRHPGHEQGGTGVTVLDLKE